MKPEDRRFAKDVAKHIDRRRVRRRVAVYTGLAGAIALAVSYLTCGHGFGIGGKGDGKGEGPGSGQAVVSDAGPRRCAVRVTAAGITLDGVKATRGAIISACKANGAEIVVTGDARQGDWDELKEALKVAGVDFVRRGP